MLKRICSLLIIGFINSALFADDLDDVFANPPDMAKPRVMWMWMGSNITKEGITFDLEKLKDAGFGGTLLFPLADICTPWAAEIKNSPTKDMIAFTDPWWKLVRQAAEESKRLHLDFGLNNCPGYETSGGTWITPELSMQQLIWSEVPTSGPGSFSAPLPRATVDPHANQPYPVINPQTGLVEKPIVEARKTFYKDIAVLAVPATGVIAKDKIIDLSSKLTPDGQLEWTVPDGKWIIYRFGYTTKGKLIQPAQWEAQGLECDKMSKEAVELHMKHIIADAQKHLGNLVGNGLSNLHFDSYEAGIPTWTPRMREEFKARRGYDLIPFLPALARRIVESDAETKKINADVAQTVADLYRDIYYPTLKKICNEAGLDLSSEPYGGPWNVSEIVPQLDRVLTEFWSTGDHFLPYQPILESSAWANKKNIIEAEALTGAPEVSKWDETPASLKLTGDDAFLAGVNRFMLHQYAEQAWGDAYKPGAVMGQWGTHFSPNQTWWEPGKAWVAYLSRCQALLQWGEIVIPSPDDFKNDAAPTPIVTKNKTTNFPTIRAIHRHKTNTNVYFIANSSMNEVTAHCIFHVTNLIPELWDPVRATKRDLPGYSMKDGSTTIPLTFSPAESCFIVFRKPATVQTSDQPNFPELKAVSDISGAWSVQFDPKWGGPAEPVKFHTLQEWTKRPENGIKYFSGTAVYTNQFDAPSSSINTNTELDLGKVFHLARVKINGRDLGVVWTAPWRVAVPAGLLKSEKNDLTIEVTNVWANRLIGDEQEPDDCKWTASPRNTGRFLAEFPEWVVKHQPRPSTGRYTFTTWNYFNKDSALIPSGLIGPVRLMGINP